LTDGTPQAGKLSVSATGDFHHETSTACSLVLAAVFVSYAYTYCISSNNSAMVLSYQWLPMSIQCGEAMARRRKEDGRVGSASHGMGRRWGRCFSCGSPRGVLNRETVPERCHSSGAVVDVCRAAPTRTQRAERAANGGGVYVSRALAVSPRAPCIMAQRVARPAPYNSRNCLPPK